jgi:putative phage-type endonuclease
VSAVLKTREEWLSDRKRGIGGSDVAAIVGMSKWRTPMDVYLDKIGEIADQPDNPSMLWGRTLEPVVRQHYCNVTGDAVALQDSNTIVQHPTIPYLLASVDGVILSEAGEPSGILEVKTARTADGWGLEWSADIPDHYALQVQHYLCVTDLDFARVAVLIGGSDFRIYHVPRCPETIDALVQACVTFWKDHVEPRVPPEPATPAEAAARFARGPAVGEVEAPDDIRAALEQLRTARERIDEWTLVVDDAKAKVQAFMADREALLVNGKAAATWKLAKAPERLDTKALRAAHPDIARRFTVAGEASRRFLVK